MAYLLILLYILPIVYDYVAETGGDEEHDQPSTEDIATLFVWPVMMLMVLAEYGLERYKGWKASRKADETEK